MSGTAQTPNLTIAARQFADLQRRLRNLEYQLGKAPLRMLPSRGGSGAAIFAQVTQTLLRADVLADPPVEERRKYGICFTTKTIEDWAAGTIYEVGTIVKRLIDDEYAYYKCLVAHTSNNDDATTANTGLWELVEDDIEAGVLGFTGNLLETIPWFQVGDLVEVVSKSGEWLIKGTVTRTEKDGKYSLVWDQDKKRAMAVFK